MPSRSAVRWCRSGRARRRGSTEGDDQAGDLPQPAAKARGPALRSARREAFPLLENQGDAGEAAVELLAADVAPALGGIEDPRALPVHPLEDDEVVKVPVEDGAAREGAEPRQVV